MVQWGEDICGGSIMKKIALYLTEYAGTTLYRYDKTRFCLVYDEDRFISVAENLMKNKWRYHIWYNRCGSYELSWMIWKKHEIFCWNCYGESEEHIKLAHVALVKAKTTRENEFILSKDEMKESEEVSYYSDILTSAINLWDHTAELKAYYQYFYNPKIQHRRSVKRLRALRAQRKTERRRLFSHLNS